METMGPLAFKRYHRFTPEELESLFNPTHLNIPEEDVVFETLSFNKRVAICVYLCRNSRPRAFETDLHSIFGYDKTYLSKMNKWATLVLYAMADRYLEWDEEMIMENRGIWADAIGRKIGVPNDQLHRFRIFGFVDGKFVATCRPSEGQELAFNGHYKRHGYCQEGAMLCNGIIGRCKGPYGATMNDVDIANTSGLIEDIKAINADIDASEQPYCLYGDAIYNQVTGRKEGGGRGGGRRGCI